MGLNNRFGVILYVVFYMPMNVLLYTGYLKNIPIALEEAACVDGASTWTTYWKIVFPIMRPMHATVAVLTALGTWNDVMTPLVIMSGGEQNTLPLAQLTFQTQFGTNYNLAFASYLLALLPILDLLSDLSETDFKRSCEWSSKIKRKGTSNMAIIFDEQNKTFTIHTEHSTYQMQIDPYGVLLHLYYGRKTKRLHGLSSAKTGQRIFRNLYDAGNDRTYSWMCSRRNFQHGEQEITEAQR